MTFAVKVISQLIKEGPHIKSTDASKIGNSDAYLNIQDAVLRNYSCHVWLTSRHHKLESFQFNQKTFKKSGFSKKSETPFRIFMNMNYLNPLTWNEGNKAWLLKKCN